nr:MAG TPA: hypothetical protein [Caudoviricetes sp.]
MTCKICYWYSVCPERSRLYPCREFKNTRRKSGRKDKSMQQKEPACCRNCRYFCRCLERSRNMVCTSWQKYTYQKPERKYHHGRKEETH